MVGCSDNTNIYLFGRDSVKFMNFSGFKHAKEFGDMSPISALEVFTITGNPVKYAILRKIALLADSNSTLL